MNISSLRAELHEHGVELEPDGIKLPNPRWPVHCPQTLRQAFQKSKRALMGRIAPPVFVVLTTRSLCRNATSGTQYAQHPSTEIVSLLSLIDELLVVWFPGLSDDFAEAVVRRLGSSTVPISREVIVLGTGPSMPPVLRQAAKSGRAFCSHDSHYRDAPIWAAKNLPQPSRWIDTRFLARAGGWPDNFNELGIHATGSDHSGAVPELVRLFCEPDEREQFRALSLDEWTAFLRGNVDRLLHLADIYDQIGLHDEPDLVEADYAINHRGIGLDVPLASAILQHAREQTLSDLNGLAVATGGAVTASNVHDVNHVLTWLRSWGLQFPNLHAETIEWLLNEACSAGVPFHPAVAAVLEARLWIARQPTGNLERALDLVDADGRIRNHLTYFSTYAGEWRGQGVRFEDFPTSNGFYAVPGSLIESIQNVDACQRTFPEGVAVEEVISSMVGLCFKAAPDHLFAIGSYVEIECRCLAWCAGDQNRLKGERGAEPWPEHHREVENAVQTAIDTGAESLVSGCHFIFQERDLGVRLPSGRVMYYRDFRQRATRRRLFQSQRDASAKGQPVSPVKISIFDQIAGDIVKAICRDVLAAALIRCEQEELPVVLHVRDQIVVEVPEEVAQVALKRLLAIMSTPPAWAIDFPIEVKGFLSARFHRSSPPEAVLVKAREAESLT